MSSTVLYMSMSLDGFIAGPNEDPGRLHEWVFPGAEGGTVEPAGGWGGDHLDGVPIYILSRNPAPDWAAGWPTVHCVSDLEAAVRDAKEAAGDKNVLVHGAGLTQRALTSGLLDEIEIHLVPVLFGDGRRMFDHLGIEQRQLERIRILEGEGGVTHLRYRVLR